MKQLILLREEKKNGFKIEEYTLDGETVANRVEYAIVDESNNTQPESQPTIEEQILAENQYQTALLEMSMIGGN